MQADDGEERDGALLRLVMRGDGKGRGGECEGRRQGDLQSSRKSVQIAPMRAHRCNLVRMWLECAQSWRRCGSGEPSPGADMSGMSPVLRQLWQGLSPVPAQLWQDEPGPRAEMAGAGPGPGADLLRMSAVLAKM